MCSHNILEHRALGRLQLVDHFTKIVIFLTKFTGFLALQYLINSDTNNLCGFYWQAVQKRKEEVAKAVDETRRKLQSVSTQCVHLSAVYIIFYNLDDWRRELICVYQSLMVLFVWKTTGSACYGIWDSFPRKNTHCLKMWWNHACFGVF